MKNCLHIVYNSLHGCLKLLMTGKLYLHWKLTFFLNHENQTKGGGL